MSLNNILNSGNPSPSWVSLRTHAIENDTIINSTNINVSGTITAGTLNITELTLDNLTVNDTIDTNNINVSGTITASTLTLDNLTVNDTIDTNNLVALNDITAPNILASNVINTPSLVVIGPASIDDLTVINNINTNSLDNSTLINTTDLTATGTVTSQNSFTVFTNTANIHNSLNTAQAVNLNVTNSATLPPISFIGSSSLFSFNSVVFNVTFTMYTFLGVPQGTKNISIRYTTLYNLYCIIVNIANIFASADYQYLQCPNPGIIPPSDFAYSPMVILDNNLYYNGFMSISPTGIISIYKNSNQDNFGAITALIPYNSCFYSII